jgi:hypothetical protein
VPVLAPGLATQSVADATSTVQTSATNVAEAMSYAAVGGVAAGQSVAAIPYVGWAMAPGVAASTYAELAAMGSMAAFDKGSWEVPNDMVAQIHQGEMIVPRTFAESLRANADGELVGLRCDFRIADDKGRQTALAAALDIGPAQAARLLKAISVLKRTGAAGTDEEDVARQTLDRIGREQNCVDFDDLIALPASLFDIRDDIAASWRERFSHVVVDEFQDIDEQQYRLLRLIAGDGNHLCVIGDPDQAIYGFRGADAACFTRLMRDFPSARTLRLGCNYRSSGTIARAAAHFIGAANAGITRPAGEPIVLCTAADEAAEAEFVAAKIEELLGGHDMLTANRNAADKDSSARLLGFGNCAVLHRTDAQASALRTAFGRAGIPFAKSSPAPIAGHIGAQAILDLLKSADGTADASRPMDIAAASEAARRSGKADAAALAEAKGWLEALAMSGAVAGDQTRLAEAVALSTEADFRDARGGSGRPAHHARRQGAGVRRRHGGRARAVLMGGNARGRADERGGAAPLLCGHAPHQGTALPEPYGAPILARYGAFLATVAFPQGHSSRSAEARCRAWAKATADAATPAVLIAGALPSATKIVAVHPAITGGRPPRERSGRP